ncbi:MAG: hypothetical protein M1133_09100 [Armatimonadetes bacterium]|nr:hypothetical protein [Armatimonadota bacterium]
MEIRVYLQDGHVTRFVQNDPVVARSILGSIQPNRLFTAPQLLIGSDHALTAFQPHLVVRVDFITDLDPSWPLSSGALNTREINQEEFETRCHPDRDVQRLPNQEIVVFGVWEMVTGERVFLQTHMTGLEKKKLPMDVGIFIQQIMTSGGLLARGRDAGYIVLNPACMLRFTSYVGLREMPANALPMSQLTD